MSGATKSCPLDPWPTCLVKECLEILITPITRLMNLSFSEGIFPQDFETAIVTPLIKKQTLPKNNFKNSLIKITFKKYSRKLLLLSLKNI
jgi:hypothetical protein